MSSIKFPYFVSIGQKHGRHEQCLLLKFRKSALLKQGGTMNCDFVGMMYLEILTKCPSHIPCQS